MSRDRLHFQGRRLVWTTHELDGLGVSGRRVIEVWASARMKGQGQVKLRLPFDQSGGVVTTETQLETITMEVLL